jgi:ubiquinone/menaquinone biosynthesis C-methylase UbiE
MITQRVLAEVFPAPTPAQLAKLLKPVAGERILEIRPGLGRHARHVARLIRSTGQMHLVDTSEHMLHEARHHTDGIGPQVHCHVADTRRLPLDDNSIDSAYLVAALPTLPDPGRALGELHRVLRPGGRLVIADHYSTYWMGPRTAAQLAARHGFRVEHRAGRLRYLTLLRPITTPTRPGPPAVRTRPPVNS